VRSGGARWIDRFFTNLVSLPGPGGQRSVVSPRPWVRLVLHEVKGFFRADGKRRILIVVKWKEWLFCVQGCRTNTIDRLNGGQGTGSRYAFFKQVSKFRFINYIGRTPLHSKSQILPTEDFPR